MRQRIRGWLRSIGAMSAPATVAAVVLALVAPALLVKGIVATHAGGDSPFLLQRTYEMSSALGSPHLPPRWMGDAAYGLGYPFWVFYGPLAYLAAGAIALLGGGVVGAIKVTVLWCFVGAAAGAYAVAARQFGRPAAGVVAAAAYSAAPYHMVNLYVRGDALGELAAYAVLPWALVAIDAAGRRRGAGLAIAVAVAALLLSHNISALLFAPVLVVYGLWRLLPDRRAEAAAEEAPPAAGGPPPAEPVGRAVPARGGWSAVPALVARLLLVFEHRLWRWRRPRSRPLLVLTGGAAMGVLLAAWFWAPALLGRDLVQLEGNLDGYFDYRGHFMSPARLVQLSPGFDYTIDSDQLPWTAGLMQVGVALAGLVAGLALTKRRRWLVLWLAVAVASTWLMTASSIVVWEAVPLLSYVQFPWRWLSVQALALSMLAAPLGAVRFGRGLAVASAIGLAVAALVGLHVVPLGVREVSREDLRAFEVFSGNLGSTVRAEYLPAGVAPRPHASVVVVREGNALPRAVDAEDRVTQATLVRREADAEAWQVSVTGDAGVQVAFPTFAFPGWQATRSARAGSGLAEAETGVPQEVGSVPGSGWLTVEVPPGSHYLELRLGRDTTRAIAEGVSLLALALAAAWYLADRRRRMLVPLVWILAAVLVSVAAARLMPVAEAGGPRVLDPLVAPYPSLREGGVSFGPTRLVRAALSRTAANAGEDFVIELGWENARGVNRVEAALVTPAEPVFGVPDVRSSGDQLQTDPVPLRLAIAEDVPTGMYFVRLRVTDGDEALPPVGAHGEALGSVYLGPVHVTGKPEFRDEPARPVARMGDVVLHAVQAAQVDGTLEVTLFWETDRLLVRDYKTSIRLVAPGGETVAQDDKQPVYGFLPTTAWAEAEQVVDRRFVDLPSDLAPGEDYRVTVVLYDEASGEELGQGQVGGVRIGPASPLPAEDG